MSGQKTLHEDTISIILISIQTTISIILISIQTKFKTMVKSTTPSRDMRALQRDLRKTKQELTLTKRNIDTFKKTVFAARDMAIVKLLRQSNQKKTLKRENQILLQSLKNFNKACNGQKKHIYAQNYKCHEQNKLIHQQNLQIKALNRTASLFDKELYLLKKGLRGIRTVQKKNPNLIRTASV